MSRSALRRSARVPARPAIGGSGAPPASIGQPPPKRSSLRSKATSAVILAGPVGIGLCLCLLAGPAGAAPRCQDLPAPIYVAGSASAGPLLKALAPLLLSDANQATLV